MYGMYKCTVSGSKTSPLMETADFGERLNSC